MTQAATNKKSNRKLLGWFWRHKATTVFCLLLIGLVGYLGVSELVLQVQIHNERARYAATAEEVVVISKSLDMPQGSNLQTFQKCSYTDFGVVFGYKALGCDTGFKATLNDFSTSNTQTVSKQILDQIREKESHVIKRTENYEPSDLMLYDFNSHGINCLYVVQIMSGEPRTNRSFKNVQIEVDCGGKAKAPYFPVISY